MTPTQAILIPGSVGELCDKISILEIKAARIKDPGKLANVTHELDLLRAIERNANMSGEPLARLAAELKRVNEMLWEIEDSIRDRERAQDFGPAFIALARSVYEVNDQRADLKKQINILCGSDIIEEKSYAARN